MINGSDSQLLALLGEELKQPLIAIAQLAELESSDEIQVQARRALRTIDNALLYRNLHEGQLKMQLEPVHVGSAMQSVQQTMKPLMKQQGCVAELHVHPSLQPVDVDKRVLHGAIESLWQAFVGMTTTKGSVIECRANKTKNGIRISLSSSSIKLDSLHFSKINPNSTQPISGLSGPGADMMTAQQLCHLIGAHISRSAHAIGVTLPISKQLQMM